MDIEERFWNASLDELKQGYAFEAEADGYVCLVCGAVFEDGRMYEREGAYYEARRAVRNHVDDEHGSMLSCLLGLDKKATGLTDLQKELIADFASGMSDADIVKRSGTGSASTIRNHRFALKERAKQAKLLLAVIELMEQGSRQPAKAAAVRDAGRLSVQRAGGDEADGLEIGGFFPEGLDGRLSSFPRKQQKKLAIMRQLAKRFEPGRRYTEKETNEVLKTASEDDYVTIRRYMVDFGFLEREDDGSAYWLKGENGVEKGKGAASKADRKQLVQQYQEQKREIGVYKIVNRENGRTFVAGSLNLGSVIGRDQFTLRLGSHVNRALQQDWNTYGEAAFDFEIVERLELPDDARYDYRDVVTPDGAKNYVLDDYKRKLEARELIWIEKLGSAEPNGYNKVAVRKSESYGRNNAVDPE